MAVSENDALRKALFSAGMALCLCGCGSGGDVALRTGPDALPFTHLYLDLDGTLLSDDGSVHPLNREAIARFRALGGHVGIATGRLPERGMEPAAGVSPDLPLVFGNGAVMTEPDGKLLSLGTLGPEAGIAGMCEHFLRAGCARMYTAVADVRTGEVRMHMGRCFAPSEAESAVVKLRANGCPEHGKLLAAVRAAARPPAVVLEEGTGAHLGVSVGPPQASKADALRRIGERLGVAATKMAFFGDSGNDTAALAYVHESGGTCFAMRNGEPEVKRACPRVTRLKNGEGGVGDALLQAMGW